MESSLSSPSSQLHVCSDGRDSWEWWLFVSVAHFEFVVLLSDSLTVAPIKVLGVVQSSKCFVLKWKTACGFSTCVVRIFLYHDFAYVKSVTKISKGYKKWNCFSKTGLNTSLIVSIVIRTATSVTEMISLKCKFHVLKGKMLICWSHQNLFLARYNAKSHGFFRWVVKFNLTILGVCENSIFLFRTV